eukprot:10734721-Ditylum_brightwellii.AAC.1
MVAQLREINSMLLYFSQPLNAKLPEDELVEIFLQLIPAGWKRTMTCANFKPLKHSMEELVENLKEVKHLETKNPPEWNYSWNNNNSSGRKKTKKGKHKRDKDEKSQDILDNNTSSKESHKHCKIFGGSAELHTTDHCNKKNLLSGLLDGHKKK